MWHVLFDSKAKHGIHFDHPQTILKEFLKNIKPNGLCTEGQFSDLETDLPVSPEVVEIGDGSSYQVFRYWEEVSFIDYRSCTGSEVKLIVNNQVMHIRFNNIDSATFKRFFMAIQAAGVCDAELPKLLPNTEEVNKEERCAIAQWIDTHAPGKFQALVRAYDQTGMQAEYLPFTPFM